MTLPPVQLQPLDVVKLLESRTAWAVLILAVLIFYLLPEIQKIEVSQARSVELLQVLVNRECPKNIALEDR